MQIIFKKDIIGSDKKEDFLHVVNKINRELGSNLKFDCDDKITSKMWSDMLNKFARIGEYDNVWYDWHYDTDSITFE